ncbi:MAG TPA: aspartate kinase, partial [Pseudomonas sp.]|nr:aspartate kinase [Pseudomonas sp.]
MHTVEKIGGTSMSRFEELLNNIFIGHRTGDELYQRVFVVSAYSGMTNLLLEHKKTGEPGVYQRFADARSEGAWLDALETVRTRMLDKNAELFSAFELRAANQFINSRIDDARECMSSLQRLCAYGHFQLDEHLMKVREMLASLGEAHSAFNSVLALKHRGINAKMVDLTGWHRDAPLPFDEMVRHSFEEVDLSRELVVATGYTHCSEGLMNTFDRGYSEITFAQIAAATGAREAIIHKEFHLSSADPKLVGEEAVRKLGHTNYDVADQLSNLGMEAIHPKAAKTLRQADVALRVTNAFDPGDPGTLIDDQPTDTPSVEIVTGLKVVALELFEQDMVGVKGYDAAILEALKRHNVWIVSKTSNANTITHYVQASLKVVRRVARDLEEIYPSAKVSARTLSLVSPIGRDLSGLRVL